MTDTLQARAWAAAASVPDPEIPTLTIADLGILRSVTIRDGVAEIAITPTYSGCPATDPIARDVAAALHQAGIPARIHTTLSPAWTTDWISEEGRRKLAAAGIAPPTPTQPTCPHCGSTHTEQISAFGSTPCKSLWRCLTCRDPFDTFKCH